MSNALYELWVVMLASAFVLGILILVIASLFNQGGIRFIGIAVLAVLVLATLTFIIIGVPFNQTEQDFLKNFDLSQVKIKGDQKFDVGATMIFKDGRLLKIVPNQPNKKEE